MTQHRPSDQHLRKLIKDRMAAIDNEKNSLDIKKKKYADYLLEWLEKEVNRMLINSIKNAKSRTFIIMNIKRSKTSFFSYLWNFSHEEMQGEKFFYEYFECGSGCFINIKELVSEKLKDLSYDLPVDLKYKSESGSKRTCAEDPSVSYVTWRYYVEATIKNDYKLQRTEN